MARPSDGRLARVGRANGVEARRPTLTGLAGIRTVVPFSDGQILQLVVIVVPIESQKTFYHLLLVELQLPDDEAWESLTNERYRLPCTRSCYVPTIKGPG
jgi:hypothetical protein